MKKTKALVSFLEMEHVRHSSVHVNRRNRSVCFRTDGSGGDRIVVKDGGARNALSDSSFVDREDDYGNVTNDASFYMNGTSIFVFGMRTVPAMIKEVLEKCGVEFDEIDQFIFHQANRFMIESIAKKAGIPSEKFYVYMESCGNTVASTIPIALIEAQREGRVKSGDKVLLAAFGVGLSWSATVVTI